MEPGPGESARVWSLADAAYGPARTRTEVPADALEAQLVRRALAGDREAFGELYARHAGEIRALIGVRVQEPAAVEDAASATWLATWKSFVARRYDPTRGRFGQWVAGIAKHEVANARRWAARHSEMSLNDELVATSHEGLVGGSRNHDSTEDLALARRALTRVVVALGQLPDVQRSALLLSVQHGMSDAQIAHRMNTTLKAVRSSRCQARHHLRQAMERETGPRVRQPSLQDRAEWLTMQTRVATGGISRAAAARELNVAPSTLRDALSRTWQAPRLPGSLAQREEFLAIRERVAAGEISRAAAARELGVPRSTLRAALATSGLLHDRDGTQYGGHCTHAGSRACPSPDAPPPRPTCRTEARASLEAER